MRRLKRVAHASLGGEMHHARELALGEQRRDAVAILEVELAEAESLGARELGEPRLLERGVVIGVEVVDADDGAPARSTRRRATWKPMNPAAPVTRIGWAAIELISPRAHRSRNRDVCRPRNRPR